MERTPGLTSDLTPDPKSENKARRTAGGKPANKQTTRQAKNRKEGNNTEEEGDRGEEDETRPAYAAKSTEDHRGSIPAQLEELGDQINEDERRRLIAEYSDEAFSAYKRDRGPGLADATQHAKDLAAEHGICELWASPYRSMDGDPRGPRVSYAQLQQAEMCVWKIEGPSFRLA